MAFFGRAATARPFLSMGLLKKLADNRSDRSLAAQLRRKRFRLFEELAGPLPRPLRILDVGGTEEFWAQMDFVGRPGVEITLLNINAPARPGAFAALTGDGRKMDFLSENAFDIVFSNSVIEHVGSWDDQQAMAAEIARVGRRYFVQTPNRGFPIEPHFLVPGFQFLPRSVQRGLVRRFALGWYPAIPDAAEADRFLDTFRLLTGREFRALFPGATIHRERFLGLTKSFIAVGGW
ncbi:MAG: methyltransferase domain-containing protein [Thermoanaerobaculia bacterium]